MKSLIVTIVLVCTPVVPADDLFTTKIEPLLRDRCFECHSHGGKMKAGLALDSRSGWERGGDSGPAIVPGKPELSLLIKMVRWTDQDHQMPPKQKLPANEIAMLEQWVKQGAADPRTLDSLENDPLDWWSLKPLKPIATPTGTQPVDAFIQSRLNENNLRPAPQADRRTLVRRLYLDLHGLMPTPEEVDGFVNDPAPNAWEKLVDTLLDSPRYGERWARHWLDVIHYADSHGCEHDVKRPNAWRFRDYVIQRLNADVPWGRFIREQLAVDVFYPDESQLTPALGFIAAGPLELSRASTAPVTFDYLDRDDMVAQTMAAFVSTTANCARCHAHKFDPITQEDYYALQAVFAGVGKGNIGYDTNPEVHKKRKQIQRLQAAIAARDANVLLGPEFVEIVDQWVAVRQAGQAKTVEWKPLDPDVFLASAGATLTKQDDGSIFAGGKIADQEHYTVTSKVDLKRVTAVRLDVLKDERHPMGGPGRAANGNLHLADVDLHWFPTGAKTGTKLKISNASADFDQAGWTSAHAIDDDLKSGWAIHPRVNESHYIVFELANPIDVARGGNLVVTLKQLYPPKHLIGRFRLSVTDAEGGAARVLSETIQQALNKPADQRTADERASIAAVALKPYAESAAAKFPPMTMVYGVSSMWSHAKKQATPLAPKVVHLLKRGDIDKPVREVGPGTLSAVRGLPARFELSDPKNESLRRAALAEWLAHRDNPLTWRSIVNRVWHYHFGRGICDTPSDFGRMGGEPSHPELLDWLAVWFRDDANGSLKALHRLILTSRTWKQASVSGSSLDRASVVDRDNRLLWRMNRGRLDAEAIRDSLLAVSGELITSNGGPALVLEEVENCGALVQQGVNPPNYNHRKSRPEQEIQRSIYLPVMRTNTTNLDRIRTHFDFVNPAQIAGQRSQTVVPTQALFVMNNELFHKRAKALAEHLITEFPQSDVRLEQLWLRVFSRPISDTERSAVTTFLRELDHAPTEANEKVSELVAWQELCHSLLASNEFIFRL